MITHEKDRYGTLSYDQWRISQKKGHGGRIKNEGCVLLMNLLCAETCALHTIIQLTSSHIGKSDLYESEIKNSQILVIF